MAEWLVSVVAIHLFFKLSSNSVVNSVGVLTSLTGRELGSCYRQCLAWGFIFSSGHCAVEFQRRSFFLFLPYNDCDAWMGVEFMDHSLVLSGHDATRGPGLHNMHAFRWRRTKRRAKLLRSLWGKTAHHTA